MVRTTQISEESTLKPNDNVREGNLVESGYATIDPQSLANMSLAESKKKTPTSISQR